MEPQLPSSITATGYVYSRDRRDFETDEVSWQQRRERVKPGTNTLADDETKKLTELAKFMESDVRASTPNNPVYSLPLISYLGTGRLWRGYLRELRGERAESGYFGRFDAGIWRRCGRFLRILPYSTSWCESEMARWRK